ncbi:MAG: hypothetical protein QOC94_4556 [Actinoplanes sp.]|jgi:hypothetical protein|nr:hypothetical protein [Actinoplanes sp.]
MAVSGDRIGVADPRREFTPQGVPPGLRQPRLPAPVPPPTGVADLPRFLRALAVRADADDLASAYAGCDMAVAAATGWDSPAALAAAHSLRSSVGRRLGELPTAGRDGRTASDLLRAAGAAPGADAVVLAVARRVAVLVDRGELEDADDLLADAGLASGDATLAVRYVRGRLHAASGRPGEALTDLFHCGQQLATRNADRPTVLPWRSAAASALATTGATESAARLVGDEVAMARRAGTASALGRALRVQGRLLPAPAGIAVLEESVRVLEGAPQRFELAGALVDCGLQLTAAKRRPQARRLLRDGLELAQRCGSPVLAQMARSAYLAAGGKVRPLVPPPRGG